MSEFFSVFFLYPLIVIIASIIGYKLFKKWIIMPLSTFVVFIILTFTIFNQSFFIWVIVYTLLSLVVCFIMEKIR